MAEELNNTDHVAFETEDFGVGYISVNENYKFIALSKVNTDSSPTTPTSTFGTSAYPNMQSILHFINKEYNIISMFRFTTRKELYQWLAE